MTVYFATMQLAGPIRLDAHRVAVSQAAVSGRFHEGDLLRVSTDSQITVPAVDDRRRFGVLGSIMNRGHRLTAKPIPLSGAHK